MGRRERRAEMVAKKPSWPTASAIVGGRTLDPVIKESIKRKLKESNPKNMTNKVRARLKKKELVVGEA